MSHGLIFSVSKYEEIPRLERLKQLNHENPCEAFRTLVNVLGASIKDKQYLRYQTNNTEISSYLDQVNFIS